MQTHSVLLKIRRLEETATEMLYPCDERSLQSRRSVNFACGSRVEREASQDFSRLLSFSLPARAGQPEPSAVAPLRARGWFSQRILSRSPPVALVGRWAVEPGTPNNPVQAWAGDTGAGDGGCSPL